MKKRNEVLSGNGKDSKVDCVLDKGNPLPTFKWEYQNMVCPDFDTRNCQPVETQWIPVPESVIMTPKQTRTNGSVVNVQSDQLAARYRCQAFNNLGSDCHVIKFVRRGKKMLRVLAINIFRRGGSYPDIFCSFVRRGKKMLHVLTMNTFRFAGSYSDILALPSCNNLLITSLFMREMNHQKSKI